MARAPKPTPRTVTSVPPALGPERGETWRIRGADRAPTGGPSGATAAWPITTSAGRSLARRIAPKSFAAPTNGFTTGSPRAREMGTAVAFVAFVAFEPEYDADDCASARERDASAKTARSARRARRPIARARARGGVSRREGEGV